MKDMTVFCTKCGAENPVDSNYCFSCGTALMKMGASQAPQNEAPAMTIELLLCKKCGAPIRYGGSAKEEIRCKYCGYSNLVYDRLSAMRSILYELGELKEGREVDPLKRELYENRMGLFRESVRDHSLSSYEQIPNFDTVLEYLSMKDVATYNKRTPQPLTKYIYSRESKGGFGAAPYYATERGNDVISLMLNRVLDDYFRLGDKYYVDGGAVHTLDSYSEVKDFNTGVYRGQRALGLIYFAQESLSKAMTTGQIVSNYYDCPLNVLSRDGPGPVLICSGPIYVAINQHVNKEEMVIAAALAKADAHDYKSGVESLSILCGQTYHGPGEIKAHGGVEHTYWRERIKYVSSDENQAGKWWLTNRWKAVVGLEKRTFGKYRWFLKPEGVLELGKYKESLKDAGLSVPSVLSGL